MVCFRDNQLCVSVYQVVGVAVSASTYYTYKVLDVACFTDVHVRKVLTNPIRESCFWCVFFSFQALVFHH